MRSPVIYNDIKFENYYYDSATNSINNLKGRSLKPVQHKTYRQITLIKDRIPYQVNYDKLINTIILKGVY